MLLTFDTVNFHPHLISWLFVALEVLLLSYLVFSFYKTASKHKSLTAFMVLMLVVIWNCTAGYTTELALMVFVNIVVLLIAMLSFLLPLLYSKPKPDQLINRGLPDTADARVDPFMDNCHRYQLSPREIEVVLLIRNGLTYRGIAESLHISESTVDTHMQNIYTKVGERGKIALLNTLEH